MPNKSLYPDFISKAIAEGDAEQELKHQRSKLKADQESKIDDERLFIARKEAETWASEKLPQVIKRHTAEGKREISLGSVDTDKIRMGYGLDVLAKVRICRAMGLDIVELDIVEGHYDADAGEEGMYACGSGTTYTVKW